MRKYLLFIGGLFLLFGCKPSQKSTEDFTNEDFTNKAMGEYYTYKANHGKSDTVYCDNAWKIIREREPYPADSTVHTIENRLK